MRVYLERFYFQSERECSAGVRAGQEPVLRLRSSRKGVHSNLCVGLSRLLYIAGVSVVFRGQFILRVGAYRTCGLRERIAVKTDGFENECDL